MLVSGLCEFKEVPAHQGGELLLLLLFILLILILFFVNYVKQKSLPELGKAFVYFYYSSLYNNLSTFRIIIIIRKIRIKIIVVV